MAFNLRSFVNMTHISHKGVSVTQLEAGYLDCPLYNFAGARFSLFMMLIGVTIAFSKF